MTASPTVFEKLASEIGLGPCKPEYQFMSDRNFRFDYAWPEQSVALEVEGGAFKGKPCPVCGQRSGGRHNRGKSFISEMERRNLAVIQGWRVIYCTPQQRDDGSILETLKRLA